MSKFLWLLLFKNFERLEEKEHFEILLFNNKSISSKQVTYQIETLQFICVIFFNLGITMKS